LETNSSTLESGTSPDHVRLIVGACLEADAAQQGSDPPWRVSMSTSVSLSELIHLRAEGLQSAGSRGHQLGQCNLCVFENSHQHKDQAPCRKGPLCERRHEWHLPWEKPRRQGRRGLRHPASSR
jgi:hypothetical protein